MRAAHVCEHGLAQEQHWGIPYTGRRRCSGKDAAKSAIPMSADRRTRRTSMPNLGSGWPLGPWETQLYLPCHTACPSAQHHRESSHLSRFQGLLPRPVTRTLPQTIAAAPMDAAAAVSAAAHSEAGALLAAELLVATDDKAPPIAPANATALRPDTAAAASRGAEGASEIATVAEQIIPPAAGGRSTGTPCWTGCNLCVYPVFSPNDDFEYVSSTLTTHRYTYIHRYSIYTCIHRVSSSFVPTSHVSWCA